jgi:signal transduction histidine kinase
LLEGFITDITESKRAEEKIAHLASFPELNPNPIFEVGTDGTVKYANPATDRLFPDLNALGTVHPLLNRFKDIISELEKGGPALVRDIKYNGVFFQQTIYYVPESGIVRFYNLDITERKRAEEELKEAKHQAELYLDLMGHDIRNMNMIGMGFLELALESSDIKNEDKELLLKSLGSLENSTRLIDNVRKLQKARSGELKHHEIDACEMFLRVLAHFSSMPGVKVSFNYEIPPSCPVMANELLYEVFENIVGNAIKHGGSETIIDVRFDQVTEDGCMYNRFIVEDNGPGIPDAFKDRIFNRLQRGDSKTKGTGLGLYLVKSLVESYGGRVCVEDRVKGDYTKGARFVVMLPAAE